MRSEAGTRVIAAARDAHAARRAPQRAAPPATEMDAVCRELASLFRTHRRGGWTRAERARFVALSLREMELARIDGLKRSAPRPAVKRSNKKRSKS
jgi:hypothetical protein